MSEAIKLGDRIAIMKDGEVVQVGTSEEILTEPANDYVARFVENVDRSKIITASSLMIDKPLVARLKKEGPEVLIRKMRAKNITVLPVIDADDKLVGEVRLNDLLKLRSRQEKSIETIVRTEVHSVLEDTVLEDILPLMTKSNSPVWVIDETHEFLGTIPLSSLIIEVTGKDKEEINEIIQKRNRFMINIGQYIETVINWMMVHFSTFFDAINAGIGSFIIGFQHVLFGIPFYITILVLAALAWMKAGRGTAIFTALGLLLIYGMGFWEATMQTLALVFHLPVWP